MLEQIRSNLPEYISTYTMYTVVALNLWQHVIVGSLTLHFFAPILVTTSSIEKKRESIKQDTLGLQYFYETILYDLNVQWSGIMEPWRAR